MFSLRYPYVVVLLSVVSVALISIGIFQLKLKTDGRALVPPNDHSRVIDKDIEMKFGVSDHLMVVIQSKHEDGIFNDHTFLLVQRLSEDLRKLNGVNPDKVLSLTTLQKKPKQRDFYRFPHFIDFNLLLDDFLKLKKITYEIDFLRGFLISLDGNYGKGPADWNPTSTVILIGMNKREEASAVIKEVEQLIEKGEDELHTLFVTGNPVAETQLGIYILQDLGKMIPVSILLMGLIFYFRYRSIYAVVLPLTEVGACILFVFGLMGLLGIPVYITIVVIPVILTAIGISDEVHVLNCYQRLVRENPGLTKTDLIRQTFKIMSRRIVLTSVTTSIGFSAFLFSPIPAVRYFGIFTAVGILFCMAWTLLVIPSLLSWFPKEEFVKAPLIKTLHRTNWLEKGVGWVLTHKRLSYVFLAFYMLASAWLTTRLEVWDSWQSGFSKQSEVRRDIDKVNTLFYGTHRLLVKAKLNSNIEEPFALERLEALENYIEDLVKDGEGGVYKFSAQISYLYSVLNSDRLEKWGSAEQNNEVIQYYKMVLGEDLLNEQVHRSSSDVLIQVFLREPDYQKVAGLMGGIEDYARSNDLEVEIGGDVATSQSMIENIVDTQLRSLVLSILMVFLLTFIYYRSFRFASVSILPPLIAIVGLFGVMGLFDIPLGVATSMFASIIIGIGVDFAIHWIESMKRTEGESEKDRMLMAIKEVGPAFILDSVIVAVAFGIMLISSIPSNSRLGLFIISGYLLCFFAVAFHVPLIYVKKGVDA